MRMIIPFSLLIFSLNAFSTDVRLKYKCNEEVPSILEVGLDFSLSNSLINQSGKLDCSDYKCVNTYPYAVYLDLRQNKSVARLHLEISEKNTNFFHQGGATSLSVLKIGLFTLLEGNRTLLFSFENNDYNQGISINIRKGKVVPILSHVRGRKDLGNCSVSSLTYIDTGIVVNY